MLDKPYVLILKIVVCPDKFLLPPKQTMCGFHTDSLIASNTNVLTPYQI